jgi:peptidoglycan/xylan/chitin deacetylase (PgdA/CDA1 family)
MNLFAVVLLLAAPLQARAQVISFGTTHQRVIALTFDAGADRGYAPQILRTLEQRHVRASFGMTGLWARANPDLVRRMARDHDTFINHTYDHRSFTGFSTKTAPLSVQQRTWEIEQADLQIVRLTGHSSRPYFRPPYGDYDSAMLTLLRKLGYRYSIMWTVDSGGWEGLSAAAIVQRCLAGARPGAIILMHVGIQSQDGIALPSVIAQLKQRGYRFVTVPRLLAIH